MHELADVYNDGVSELQRRVYIKHTKISKRSNFIRFALKTWNVCMHM